MSNKDSPVTVISPLPTVVKSVSDYVVLIYSFYVCLLVLNAVLSTLCVPHFCIVLCIVSMYNVVCFIFSYNFTDDRHPTAVTYFPAHKTHLFPEKM